MKQYVIIVLLLQFVAGCTTNESNYGYDYVKIVTFRNVDSGNAYNKGLGIWSYLFYKPDSDSVVLRRGHFESDDSSTFSTYVGKFKNQHYADTVSMLVSFLRHYNNGDLSYEKLIKDNSIYDGPEYSVEYSINGKPHFISFIIVGKDTLNNFENFYWRLPMLAWNKNTISNSTIHETEEIVHMLKGLGSYDTLVYTPPYIPLPCKKGIKMDLLYGKWRTFGYVYGNGKQAYTTNFIGKDGSWIMERFHDGEMYPRYSGKIASISRDNIIKVKSNKKEEGIATLQILNLTENCLEYMPVGSDSNQIWRLDRMK